MLKDADASSRNLAVSHCHADDFRLDGLRPYAEYRDFGFAEAAGGALSAHVLRFLPGYDTTVAGKRHIHDVDFQMVYLFKGWISYEFEGVGPITMHAGNAWTQPPGIRHTVTGYSDDCELMELVMPVEYATIDVDPAGTTVDATTPIDHLLTRRAGPQRFVVGLAGDPMRPATDYPTGTTIRDFGFDAATDGLAQGCELHFARASDGTAITSTVPNEGLRLGYVLDGTITVTMEPDVPIAMRVGSCWLEQPGSRRIVSGWSAGAKMIELSIKLPR
jgi:quercetin dioxygenase-like cupin family protein